MKHPIKTTIWAIEYSSSSGQVIKDRIPANIGLLTMTEARYCITQALPPACDLISIHKTWGFVENPLLK